MDLPCAKHPARCRALDLGETWPCSQRAHSLVGETGTQIIRPWCRTRVDTEKMTSAVQGRGDFSDKGRTGS